MNHQGTRWIETERILLRKFTMEDVPAAFRNWTSEEAVTKYLRWPAHRNMETTERIIGEWIKRYRETNFYQWAIEWKTLGEPIGTISVVDQNERLGILHIGYCIGSQWWHRGITSEALAAILPYLFEEVGANRVESQHDPENVHSGEVMKKCGMVYEGTLRQADESNRGIVDACVYSLLRDEWRNQHGKNMGATV